MTEIYGRRDCLAAALCNWVMRHIASGRYRKMIDGSIRYGLAAAARDDAGCWSWWESGGREGRHRCALRDGHMDVHECCCGEKAAFANRSVAHDHQRGTPCGSTCPLRRRQAQVLN